MNITLGKHVPDLLCVIPQEIGGNDGSPIDRSTLISQKQMSAKSYKSQEKVNS